MRNLCSLPKNILKPQAFPQEGPKIKTGDIWTHLREGFSVQFFSKNLKGRRPSKPLKIKPPLGVSATDPKSRPGALFWGGVITAVCSPQRWEMGGCCVARQQLTAGANWTAKKYFSHHPLQGTARGINTQVGNALPRREAPWGSPMVFTS